MSKNTETELAFEWVQKPVEVKTLQVLNSWDQSEHRYTIVDSIYDSKDNKLAKLDTGVRVRTQDNETVVTAKKFVKKGENGEAIFDEYSQVFTNNTHPSTLNTDNIELAPSGLTLNRQLSFVNNRLEVVYVENDSSVHIVNEVVTYSNENSTYTENLLEIEFENATNKLVKSVKEELEATYNLKQISEGKTDRAARLLSGPEPLVQNFADTEPVVMSAHGGKGKIEMRFFHTPFSRFDKVNDPKVTNYTMSNWDFFAHAVLPVGAEVKEHLHDRTDEIYYILSGSATLTVDGKATVVKKGDCILTRKGSKHSLTQVTEELEFIATEIIPNA